MENFKYVLYLFSCAARNKKVKEIKDIDIKTIYTIAIKHKIWNIVYLAVSSLYRESSNVFGLNEKIFEQLKTEFQINISRNILKWNTANKIFAILKQNDIEVCLLKGMTIGVLYAEPYSRTTSDIDLLLNNETEEKKACDVMKELGFEIMHKSVGSHHSKCLRKDVGLIEIHTQLYDKEVQKVWYGIDKRQSRYKYIDFESKIVKCKQLCHNDNFMFIFLHFVKHYINGLVTIKQVMDIMLYLSKHIDKIEINKFENQIKNQNYFKLYKTLKLIAVKYMDFSLDELGEDESLFEYEIYVEDMLNDLYKYAAMDNVGVYHTYTKRSIEKRQIEKTILQKLVEMWKNFWTSKKRMRELYPILEKQIWLLPFMYIHRFFDKLKKVDHYVNKETSDIQYENAQLQDRIKLFEELGVM